jgi:hypothetical protein
VDSDDQVSLNIPLRCIFKASYSRHASCTNVVGHFYMGQRTVYYKSINGKTLRENLKSDYAQFRDWALTSNSQSLTEDDERLINVDLETLLKDNATDKLKEWSQESIDNLVFEYLLTYCDYGPGQEKFKIVGPMMSTWRYEKSDKLINSSSDKDLITIWNYLTKGRSIKNNCPFISPDNDGQVIGFWDWSERDFLSQRLIKFDKVERDNEGIEYVLSVIDELKNDKSDLIINVEK